ncbi:MAG: hypothetical protein AB7L17_15595 [Ilumatobacteraceae bacterium]
MKGQTPATIIDLTVDEAAALLSVRPARWLGAFLRLATHRFAAETAEYTQAEPWYRLRAPQVDPDGAVRARLVWHPHLGHLIFTTFRGDIRAEADGDRTLLLIEGELDGGDVTANQAVLDELVRLLAVAAAGRQSLGG